MKITRNEDIFFRKELDSETDVKELLESDEPSEKGYITLIESGTMHQLNYLGGRIWELCDGTRTLVGIADDLKGEFDIEEEELLTDVEDFVNELIERGWLSYA